MYNLFSIPGLMEIQVPVSDALPTTIKLSPHKASDTLWRGLDTIGPITLNGLPMDSPASSAVWEFSRHTDGECVEYTLSSDAVAGNGSINILDASSWLFEVVEQPLPLDVGLWYWVFVVTDAAGNDKRIYRGTLLIRP